MSITKFDDYLFEDSDLAEQYKKLKYDKERDELNEKVSDSDVNVIILTSRKEEKDDKDLFRTAGRISKICKSKKIPHYVVFAEDSHIIRHDDGSRTIHNVDDEKGFPIEAEKTVALIRGSVAKLRSSMNTVTQLERNGICCINSRRTIEACSDKYRTILRLADAALPTPKTALLQNINAIDFAFESIGGNFPVVCKTLSGSKGVGVFYSESWKSLKSILEMVWKINDEEELLIQQYIDSPYDLRVHVLGDEVIAAMKRFVVKEDFRSNYSLGGKIANAKLTSEQKDMCVTASKAVGVIWGGVDFILDKKGNPYIIEINSSPGTEGIEKATNLDVVNTIVDYIIDKNNWVKVAQECGFREILEVKGIGNLEGKFDTGNGSLCVIHTDEYKIDKNIVRWKIGDKKFKHKYKTIKEVNVGGLRDYSEERPVIELDVVFDGVIYKAIDFTLGDRNNRIPILLNRKFMRKANVMVNPSKTFVLTKKE